MILKLRTIAVPQAGGPAGELSPIPARHPWRVMAAVLLTLLFLFFNRPASGAELSDSHIRRSIGKHVISETAATQDQVDIKVNKGIVVKPRLQRDNKDIASDMDRRLAADLYVDDANIEVTVKDGRANLQGTVGTAAENRRAADNAWVNGVVSVDERQLMVVWGKNDHMRRASPHIRQSDQTILKAVKDALLMDPRVNAANPDVSVVNGAVTLSGVVETLYAKRETLSDTEIAADIMDELFWSPYVDSDRIGVTVKNGQAALIGTAASRFAAHAAVQNAFEGGAKTVQTKLVLDDGSVVAELYRAESYRFLPNPILSFLP